VFLSLKTCRRGFATDGIDYSVGPGGQVGGDNMTLLALDGEIMILLALDGETMIIIMS